MRNAGGGVGVGFVERFAFELASGRGGRVAHGARPAPHIAAPVAYVSGSLGTLIGADLLNINKLSSLGGGVASIGGAGAFDGVFLSGIVAVLLVAVA